MAMNPESVKKIEELLQAPVFCESKFEQYVHEDNVNSIIFDDWTSLMLAIMYGNSQAVSYLIELGADLEKTGMDKRTPLMKAVLIGNEAIVNLLLQNKCQVSLYDPDGYPLLHMAVRNKLIDLIHILIEKYHANVNEVVVDECATPLIIAAEENRLDIVKLLIRSGAVIDFMPKEGLTALAIASIGCYLHLVKYLLHMGASTNLAKISIKSRLDDILRLSDFDDVEKEIQALRRGFEFLLQAAKEELSEELAHNRFEFFNDQHAHARQQVIEKSKNHSPNKKDPQA